jgi:hypothetical protein
LRQVADGTPALALSLIADVLHIVCGGSAAALGRSSSSIGLTPLADASPYATPSVNVWERPGWLEWAHDRLALALVWAADGVGADSASRMGGDGPAGGGGAAAAGMAAAAARGGGGGGGGAITMQVPRLPLLHLALRLISTVYRAEPLRHRLASALELVFQRVLLRALSAPARLIQGCAVLVGPSVMRTVLAALVDAQRQRDAYARSLAAANNAGAGGPSLDPSASPLSVLSPIPTRAPLLATAPPHLSIGAVSKAILASLAANPALNGAVDSETVQTLVRLLSPRSPLMLAASAALDTLHCLISASPTFAVDTFLWYDSQTCATDVLRGLVQVRS